MANKKTRIAGEELERQNKGKIKHYKTGKKKLSIAEHLRLLRRKAGNFKRKQYYNWK